jgi:glutaredoxin
MRTLLASHLPAATPGMARMASAACPGHVAHATHTAPRRRMAHAHAALLVSLALATATATGCPRGGAVAGGAADDAAATGDGPPEPRVSDDATSLLYSFVDATGRMVAVGDVAEVPEPVRSRVLVVDLDKSPEERQAHRYAFFTDLTVKRPDGTYPVTVVSRYDATRGTQARAPALPPTDGSVVLYSAVWCGYCKQAAAWLKRNNVPFIERDVEKTPGAQQELQQKLAAAGIPGGGIPVTDWGGSIVVGFDQAAYAKLLADKPPPAATNDVQQTDDRPAAP